MRQVLPGIVFVILAVVLALKPWKTDTNIDATAKDRKEENTGQATMTQSQQSRIRPESQSKDQPSPEVLDPAEMEAIIEELQGLSSEYSPSAIPKIAVYFDSAHPEVRSEALQSMLQLGERAAVPYLLKAAENAPTPDEAAALKEAAEWLELPSSSSLKS